MTRLPCLAVAAGLLGLGAAPAAPPTTAPPRCPSCSRRCSARRSTRSPGRRSNSLLSDAKDLCEEGEQGEARTKFANVRELLEGDREERKDGAAD